MPTVGPDLGRIVPDTNDTPLHTIGEVRYRFRYDGLGRLIEREQYTVSPPTTPVAYKTLHYYYDGVRIVQEVVETPSETTGQPATFHTEREYVYGPDYVDEFVALVDDPGATTPPLPSYMLQDANFNVMALVALAAGDDPLRILSQYQYEPYGPLAREDHLDTVDISNENVVGHQGLFFHRLSPANLSLAPGTQGLYYTRNRWYNAQVGAFMGPDPRATGLLVLGTPASMNSAFWTGARTSTATDCGCSDCGCTDCGGCESRCGEGVPPGNCCNGPGQVRVSPRIQYADGMNLRVAFGADPVNHRDPSGLFLEMILSMALGAEADAAKAKQDIRTAAGLSALLTALLYQFDRRLADAITDIWTDTVDRSRSKCECQCVKPDPSHPGKNQGPYGVGWKTRSECQRWPYTGGAKDGYERCFCK